MSDYKHYDVIVIGAGHAGCEAALAAARMGSRVMLITMNLDHIAKMSCNPAVGGIGKGQVVREIDALGGEMAKNTDASAIQFRMLNKSKGPAVWSPRAQTDKLIYQRRMKHVIERETNIFVHEAEVVTLLLDKKKSIITGIRTHFEEDFFAKAVVICTGTFLKGLLHFGDKTFSGGRSGDAAADFLSDCFINELELKVGRLKTGTPPRVMKHGIDFTGMQEQLPDPEGHFSHWNDVDKFLSLAPEEMPQQSCWLIKSTLETKQIVLDNIDRSPMYSGRIEGIGPRYCPSFEDKVMRFAHHETHQIYLEPEGSFTEEFYLNGISTSLPTDVQWMMIRSLPGLENAEISRYAYAVEYDFVHPHQLRNSLAVINWPNLYLAGQINGTTGYEEAGGQGIIAGINASLEALSPAKEKMVLGRDQAYIGVMIDDLVTKDIVEPYRLFTSRAEYRLILRQDNCCRRLSKQAHELGLLPWDNYKLVLEEEKHLEEAYAFLHSNRAEGETLWERVRKKKMGLEEIDEIKKLPAEIIRQIDIEAHYDGYIKQEKAQAAKMQSLESWKIAENFEYDMPGLRNESRQKLSKMRPDTLAQAARIDGVTPAEIALLQVHLKRHAG
ncbi:MAG: tRNA uridine-5-carboxymethylaminomethyl(34) synthesis enzyme MnmG [Lentisphaeria bacterium]|nr:tRNA uridine-5-carboxymethylaminomethyl(34) synthesis enzyme MnmG [Lentisphaeria bacterium]NQZ71361.1 tRNA uridine-5-carboxymethylaminomethyl(34) synthesis enzyme MnmG [Lentisphaeria bacterium]